MYRRSSDWRLRLSDEGMGKQVKMEGVERSDAARLLGPAKRPGLPASIGEHDDYQHIKHCETIYIMIYKYIEYAINHVYDLLSSVHDKSIKPPG